MVSGTCNHEVAFRHLLFAIFQERARVLPSSRSIFKVVDHEYLRIEWWMNKMMNIWNTENSGLHRYCQKETKFVISISFWICHFQVGDYNSKRAIYESVFVNPGIYSCAVDAFLEISMHLILPYLSNLHIWNEFTDLLFNVCSHYMSLREDSSLLSKIWALFGRKSLTFVVHSQLGIVMPVLTRYLRKEHLVLLMKKRAFSCMILRKFDSYCSSCSNLPGLWIALFF